MPGGVEECDAVIKVRKRGPMAMAHAILEARKYMFAVHCSREVIGLNVISPLNTSSVSCWHPPHPVVPGQEGSAKRT